MDLDEVKACIRALLSSTAFSYRLNDLLIDFKSMTGRDLPLFECLHPIEFLKTLNDTVELFGDPYNPEIALVKSKKSAHIISLVNRQKIKTSSHKNSNFGFVQRRLVLPDRNAFVDNSKENSQNFKPYNNFKETKKSLLPEGRLSKQQINSKLLRYNSQSPKTYADAKAPDQSERILPLLDEKVDHILRLKSNNYSNQISNCTPCQDTKAQPQKTPFEPEQTDSCFFEDISDNETSLSFEESRSSSGQAVSASCCFVNDGIKNKLKRIIQNYPQGLWCCELPDLFLEEFNFVLDYREFGYTSLIQMLSELPDVFRCVRPGKEDWILFDASVPPSSEEKKMMALQTAEDVSSEIRANIQRLLFNYLENSSDSGIEMNKIPDLYQKMFGTSLNLQSLGFKDIKSLLEIWEGSLFSFLRLNGKIIVVPVSKLTTQAPKQWEEAVPPITPENDIFADIFPKDVVGPDESLPVIDLVSHVAVGQLVEVCVAEVWSPSKFFLQLNKFKSRLNRFMDDLQKFYNVHLAKYKMPDSTIQPNQVCVGLYNADPDFPDEWHRAQIIKVINEKLVLINFVDFGTVTRVRKTQLRFMHRSFQSLPIQAFQAELSGVAPPNDGDKWPMSTSKKFLELLRVPYLDAKVVYIDFKKFFISVILYDSFQKSVTNINERLVSEKLARVKEPQPGEAILKEEEPEAEDSKLIKNKTSAFNGNSSDVSVQEPLSKDLFEVVDEFSDIADLSPTTLFHFKMKSLGLENSPTFKANNDPCNGSKVSYEFEEVPELESKEEEENISEPGGEKESALADEVDNKNSSESSRAFLEVHSSSPPPSISEDESLNHTFPVPGMSLPEKDSLSFLGKPKRLPPGLEHMSFLPDFNQIHLLMQTEDLKKRVNVLAMELLTTSPSIKQVGVMDPALALKIATEMAEVYVSSEYSGKLFLSAAFSSQSPSSFMNKTGQDVHERTELDVPVAAEPPVALPETQPKPSETTENMPILTSEK